jgi:competence protein ComEA
MKLSLVRARAACSRALLAWRSASSAWTKPALRVILAAAALLALAAIGKCAASDTVHAATALATVEPAMSAALSASEMASAPAPSAPVPAPPEPSAAARHGPASSDDPVVLNQATPEDLQRLPGIGPKRAMAIVALRSKLGRFRQVEDLLRVRGIGRATLKRLKPLVRLDPPPPPDGGSSST